MIRWDKIEEEDICGLTKEEVDFVFSSAFAPSEKVGSHTGLTAAQASDLMGFDCEDSTLTEEQLKEVRDAETDAEVKSTAAQTAQHVAKFDAFLKNDVGVTVAMRETFRRNILSNICDCFS